MGKDWSLFFSVSPGKRKGDFPVGALHVYLVNINQEPRFHPCHMVVMLGARPDSWPQLSHQLPDSILDWLCRFHHFRPYRSKCPRKQAMPDELYNWMSELARRLTTSAGVGNSRHPYRRMPSCATNLKVSGSGFPALLILPCSLAACSGLPYLCRVLSSSSFSACIQETNL